MAWRLFKKPNASLTVGWWANAAGACDAPTADIVASLERDATPSATDPDEHERQTEMLDGLRALAAVVHADALPVVDTQHRVVGEDACHFLAPASLANHVDTAGKLFLTSRRLVFMSGGPRAWPWHRIQRVTRIDRDVVIQVVGQDDMLAVRCNTYGDAIIATYIANRLREDAGR